MADDITLTVRVRDLTHGDFNRVRQRMRGMDGDIRRMGQSSQQASQRASRLGQEIRGVSGRLGQLQRTGSLANHEMSYMRRTMSLLGRDLRNAARAGDLTEDQFRSLRDALEETRVQFDRLDRDVNRHSTVAQRRAREAAAAQREELRQQTALGQQIVAERRRIARAQDAALRENARREREAANERARQDREELRRQMALGRQIVDQQRRISRAHDAALREEEARNRRAMAARRQAEAQMSALLRRQEAEQRRSVAQLAGGGSTDDVGRRFQSLGDGDVNRMARALASLSHAMGQVDSSSASTHRSVQGVNRDLRVMSQVLRNAQRDGSLTRRELTALSNGLRDVERSARAFSRSGDLGRASYRSVRREAELLRAQLRLLGGEGSHIDRLSARMLLFQRRMRDSRDSAHGLRRVMNRMGDWGSGGLRAALRFIGPLIGAMGRLGAVLKVNKRWTAIFIAALLLIGPIAQALGALLVTALGGAFVALGAFALRGNAQVKSAFQSMKSTIGSTVREAAQPLAGPLSNAMRHLGDVAAQLGPQLRRAFEATGPIAESFSRAIGNLASKALPGMVSALQHSKGAMQGFEQAMGMIGQGIGDMFDIITSGNDTELARAWVTLGNEIRNVFESIGQFISTSLKSGTATLTMIAIFRTFTGVLNLVAGSLRIVDGLTLGVFTHLADAISGFKGIDQGVGRTFDYSTMSLTQLQSRLKDVGKAIKEARQDLRDTDDIQGPAKDTVQGPIRKRLAELLEEQSKIKDAITSTATQAKAAYKEAAAAVQTLIDKTRELNELNRGNLDARAQQQRALLDANKGYKEFADALRMTNGQLDLTSEKSLDAYDLLSKLAGSTNDATKAAADAKRPWSEIQAAWKTGYDNIVRLGDGMGLTKEEAKILADQLVKMPDADVTFKANTVQAISDLNAFIAKVKESPGSRSVTLKTLSARAEAILENFGYKVTHLKNGSVKVTAMTGTAATNIQYIQGILDALNGQVATTYVQTVRLPDKGKSVHDMVGAIGGAASSLAHAKRFADGGSISGGVLDGPGTKTSDSLFARLSRGEFVMRASAVDKYGVQFMQAVNHGLLDKLPGFAKGGKVSKSEADARKDARSDLTLTTLGRVAGYKRTEFASAVSNPDSLTSLVDSLNHWAGIIKKATHGGVEKSLLKQLTKAGTKLISYQKALTKVEKELDAAKEKLSGLKEAAAQLKDSVKQGIISGANITKSATAEDSQVTINTLLSQMTANAANANQFSGMLKELAKRGVDKNIIQQVAEAGIEGGGMETAAAILGGSKQDIARLNQLQGQIIKAGDSAGKTAADAMYAAGIKAAEGLVNGLTKKKKSIEAAMMSIAKSMEKSIKKALGIKSPSRVMQEVGHYTAEGFAVGMKKNTNVARAWDSMLNVRTSASPVGGMGGDRPIHIQLSLGGKDLGEVIIDPLRKTISHRGGNVQAVLGR